MIILDANVASEIINDHANPRVVAWVDDLDVDDLAITAITAAEMRLGAELVPAGRRRTRLRHRVEQLIEVDFAGFVWPFDGGSSQHYAEVMVRRSRSGRPISTNDAQIAAICLQHDAVLATRNVKDFIGTGVEVVNPWDA